MKNKKISLIVGIVLCVAAQINVAAQNINAQLIGGITASQVDGDNSGGFNKFGFVVGGTTYFPISERIDLQQEICYYMRGSRNSSKEPVQFAFRMNYLDLGVLGNFNFTDEFKFQGGLVFGVLLSARQTFFGGFVSDMNDANSLNPATSFGLGYQLNENLEINARALYSITRIQANTFPNRFHNSLALSLRYNL